MGRRRKQASSTPQKNNSIEDLVGNEENEYPVVFPNGAMNNIKNEFSDVHKKNTHSYAHLIFDKSTKNIRWRKDSLFNKCCWKKWISACKILKLDPSLSPCTSIISKSIRTLISDLNP
jgi:hypothetical protein